MASSRRRSSNTSQQASPVGRRSGARKQSTREGKRRSGRRRTLDAEQRAKLRTRLINKAFLDFRAAGLSPDCADIIMGSAKDIERNLWVIPSAHKELYMKYALRYNELREPGDKQCLYFVEQICGWQTTGNSVKFIVKWWGFKETTREPIDHLNNCDVFYMWAQGRQVSGLRLPCKIEFPEAPIIPYPEQDYVYYAVIAVCEGQALFDWGEGFCPSWEKVEDHHTTDLWAWMTTVERRIPPQDLRAFKGMIIELFNLRDVNNCPYSPPIAEYMHDYGLISSTAAQYLGAPGINSIPGLVVIPRVPAYPPIENPAAPNWTQ